MELSELSRLAENIFKKHGIARHQIRWIPGRVGTLEVMIMKEDGSMDMDTCALVSQDLSKMLDEIDYSDAAYNLDVCSFGAEQPLQVEELDDYIDAYIHVELKNPAKGMDMLEGTLRESNEKTITMEYMDKGRKKTAEIEKDNIRFVRTAVKL
ncbi:MAG: ribosome maturation factor RimP [Erysipelotrichaceae bacterium]|nr:ribosome maturation factor RimP [Erysipelotrichaceae bacterium]